MKTRVGDKVRVCYNSLLGVWRGSLGNMVWKVMLIKRDGAIIVAHKGAAYRITSWVRVRK